MFAKLMRSFFTKHSRNVTLFDHLSFEFSCKKVNIESNNHENLTKILTKNEKDSKGYDL